MPQKFKQTEYICVFDCETIPDVQTLEKTLDSAVVDECRDSEGGIDYLKLSQKANQLQKENSGSEFLPVCFHEIVCISAVMADKFGRFLRVSTMDGANEKQKIEKFIAFVNEHNPRLISFNGRGFDLPMIMIRAMRYNIACPAYFETDNLEFNKNKWENYRSRYDGRFHMDLLDHISEFRAVSGLNLDHLCAALGLPGKYDVSGDMVMSLHYQGRGDKINEYCESDVLNTYWLFLKYELLRGKITLQDYSEYLLDMREFITTKRANLGYSAVFAGFIDDEIKRLN